MSFDEIFDLTAGVYFNFYNIHTYEDWTQNGPDGTDHLVFRFSRSFVFFSLGLNVATRRCGGGFTAFSVLVE